MSDADIQFHEAWLGMVQPTEGLVVSIPVLVDAQVAHRHPPQFQEQFRALLEPAPDSTPDALRYRAADSRNLLTSLLEWPSEKVDSSEALPKDLSLYVPEGQQVLAPSFALRRAEPIAGGDDTPAAVAGRPYLALVWEIPEGLDFDKAETKTGAWEYPPAAKFDRLLRQCRVPVGLLSNHRAIRLIYAPHGEATGSITFRLDDMASIGGRWVLDAFVGLLGSFRVFGAAKEQQLPAILEESRRRQINVTNQLADQVFEALQILLTGFESAAERDERYRQLLDEAVRQEDDHVYSGLLTVLLRLVFVLYAEDRALLPVEKPFYSRHLSLLSLFAELQSDFGAFPDSMARRFGAWPRLLALFRAIYLGCEHDDLRMPPRRGELFDPHLCPFLEGWGPAGGAPIALAEDRSQVAVPTVDDFTVFQVLHRLLLLEGQRLSYRTLDVEQIGSVYEALMGYHVERSTSSMVCLKPERANAVWLSAETLLEIPEAQRAKWLQEEIGLSKSAAAKISDAASSAKDGLATLEALEGFSRKNISTAHAGRLLIQPGGERRRTSSHYTPRSLSAPIVARTLEPLIRVMGDAPASERLLNLKICDPAMGSGAFLVESCRYLGDEVVKAWTREGRLDKVADQHDDVVNHARRLVAQRCLYGVDKNPFAVNLAKLSLWLVTLAKDEPFTFVDHALRHGDSLVGLDFEQIKSFHWKPSAQLELCRGALEAALGEAIALRQRILDLAASSDSATTKEKYRLLQDAEDALRPARLIGDLVVGAFFFAEKDKDREKERNRRLQLVEDWLASGDSPPVELVQLQAEIQSRLPVFHWMTEFPEIFYAERPDPLDEGQVNRAAQMDAFVGNPPFLGGLNISENWGSPAYQQWLKINCSEAQANTDLCAFFFRRCAVLLGAHGAIGLIATNSISEGATREGGLAPLVRSGLGIYDATTDVPWPGTAAIFVSAVHIARGTLLSSLPKRSLNGIPCAFIDSRLQPRRERPDPMPLTKNEGLAFVGTDIRGAGFVLAPEDRAELVASNSKNGERLFEYMGGRELNTHPSQSNDRYVIDFAGMGLAEASSGWPELLSLVRERVKPGRDKAKDHGPGLHGKKYWWQHALRSVPLYEAIAPLKRCLAVANTSKRLMVAFQPVHRVFANTVVVFSFDSSAHFALLQSRVHGAWAMHQSSSLGQGLRYTVNDCFQPFPFPIVEDWQGRVESIGQKTEQHRSRVMLTEQVGLTELYNRLEDASVSNSQLDELRDLHLSMDEMVLSAYGWSDIKIPPFVAPQSGGEIEELERFNNQIVDRLFELNARRVEEEKALGLGTAKSKAKGQAKVPQHAKKTSKSDKQMTLVSEASNE